VNLIHFIKQYYQQPFRNELQSVVALALNKSFTKLLAIAYLFIHSRRILQTRLAVNRIRSDVRKKNKSAFVFANGPSMQDINLTKIKKLVESGEFDLIAINSFMSKSASEVSPTFAVFADNRHFAKNPENKQLQNDRKVCQQQSITQFVPFQYLESNAKDQIGYNSFCDIYSSNTDNILYSPGFYGLTALHALRLGIHLDYNKIYICGFDNSYFKDFEVKHTGEMIIRHRHYYDEQSTETEVPCIFSILTGTSTLSKK
jgi:hypothetical protein